MTSHADDRADLSNDVPDVSVAALGGGYAGVTAALRLDRSRRVTALRSHSCLLIGDRIAAPRKLTTAG